MESSQLEDSKGLSNESDIPDQVNDDMGASRFYECMFCKQGFTTAQALGGHMNIHRRDRARIRQPTIPSLLNQPREDYVKLELPPTISTHPQRYSQVQATSSSNYPLYFPPSITSNRSNPHPYHTHDFPTQKPQPLSLFDDDGFTNLSLQIGPMVIDNKEEGKRKGGEEDQLDLELRLGHDP